MAIRSRPEWLLGPATRLRQAAAYQSQQATVPGSVQAILPTAWRTAPHSGHARIVSIRSKNSVGHRRVRIGQFLTCACQHGTSEGHPCQGASMSNMEFVLCFTLSHPGTSNPVHLASNIAVVERGPLPADLYEEAKKRLPLPDAR
jgi:hypothetical protein